MKILNCLRILTVAAVMAAASLQAGDMVPAKAKTAGQVVSKTFIADPTTSPLGTPFLIVNSEGVGNATLLGKYTIDLKDVQRLEMIDGKLMIVSQGTFVATAANGDQLFGTFTNYRIYGQLAFTGVSEFTGGTGRFEGVSGSETTVGEIEPDLMHFSYTHDGFFTSVGSRRGNGH